MKIILIYLSILFFFTSCGIYRPTDARKVPVNANERVKKNIEEGRGFRLSSIGKNNGEFLFASSNPMWRATLEKLDFAPLNVVDYSGGMIATDWYNDGTNEEEIKISVKFLSNEIRSDAIEILIHTRLCKSFNDCKITKISNNTNQEIKLSILKRAAELKNQDFAKTKEEIGEYKIPGKNF